MSLTSWRPQTSYAKRTKHAHELLPGEYLSVAGVWKEIEQVVQVLPEGVKHGTIHPTAGRVHVYFVDGGSSRRVFWRNDLLEVAILERNTV